jgi:hypothetical protein
MTSQPVEPANPDSARISARQQTEPQPSSVNSPDRFSAPARSAETGNDDGIVHVADSPRSLTERAYADDPDGDIVHPHARRPGEIVEGTTIRVRLLQRLSTVSSEKGEAFHTMVASDVLQGGQVVIPAGAEIDGQVIRVSSGHVGGHGSMRLAPETVTLPDGMRFRLHAEITGTPGSKTRIGSEGAITPASRLKRDGIEYGGAVGAGLVTGAVLGGRQPDWSRRGDGPPACQPSASHSGIGHDHDAHADRAAGYGSGAHERELRNLCTSHYCVRARL